MSNKELEFTKKLAGLMEKSPTSFNVIEQNKKILDKNGYVELNESEEWKLTPGGKYYLTRNLSTLVAFQMPKTKNPNGFMIVASHSDHPCFKIKQNTEIDIEGEYTLINTDPYANLMYYTWMDRPLTVGGKIFRKTKSGIKTEVVNANKPLFLIPSLSNHQQDNVNKNGFRVNAHTQLRPLFGGENAKLLDLIADNKKDIIDYELYAVQYTKPLIWGANNEYLSARAIDDQACVYCSLLGFIEATPKNSIPIHVVFDNEEPGSATKQGAASILLTNVLKRIAPNYKQMLPSSFIVSADNGHAFHPNYPEITDSTMKCHMGKGIVLKYSTNLSYSTDGLSSAIALDIAKSINIPIQKFYNKAGAPHGSTLGKFISPETTIACADMGLAQLAMHSGYETCSTKDPIYLKEFMKKVYSSSLKMEKDGNYKLN